MVHFTRARKTRACGVPLGLGFPELLAAGSGSSWGSQPALGTASCHPSRPAAPPPHPKVASFSTHHPQPPHNRFLPAWPGGSSPDPCPDQDSLGAPSPARVAPHSSLSQLLEPICLSSESSPPEFLTARLSPGRFPVPLEHGAGHPECHATLPKATLQPRPFPSQAPS